MNVHEELTTVVPTPLVQTTTAALRVNVTLATVGMESHAQVRFVYQ